MQLEVILVCASLGGTVIVGAGLYKTWKKNGKEQRDRDLLLAADRAARDARLSAKLDSVGGKVDVNIARVTEVKGKVDDLAKNCAGTVGTFAQKHLEAERRLAVLDDKVFRPYDGEERRQP